MNEKIPNHQESSAAPEFDLFNLSDVEQNNPVLVNQVLVKALEVLSSWGRDSGEVRDVQHQIQLLQAGKVNSQETYNWIKALLAEKQDYN